MKVKAEDVVYDPGYHGLIMEPEDLDRVFGLSMSVDDALTVALAKQDDQGNLDNEWYEKILSKLGETEQNAFTMGLATEGILVQEEIIEEPMLMNASQRKTIEELKDYFIDLYASQGCVYEDDYHDAVYELDGYTAGELNMWFIGSGIPVKQNPPRGKLKDIVPRNKETDYKKRVRQISKHPDIRKLKDHGGTASRKINASHRSKSASVNLNKALDLLKEPNDSEETEFLPAWKKKRAQKIKILYPEERFVSPEQIISWANDILFDSDLKSTDDLTFAIEVLEDAGAVTVADPKEWEKKRAQRDPSWATEEAERWLLNDETLYLEALQLAKYNDNIKGLAIELKYLFEQLDVMPEDRDDIEWDVLAMDVLGWEEVDVEACIEEEACEEPGRRERSRGKGRGLGKGKGKGPLGVPVGEKFGSRKTADFRLTPSDKRVILKFIDREPGDSKHFETDGTRLDGSWMGGHDLAHWEGDKLVLVDVGSRIGQTVHNFIRKNTSEKWLANASEGDVVFHATTRGNRYEIKVFRRDDGLYDIKEYKHGNSVGVARNYTEDEAIKRLQDSIEYAAAIDGINYQVVLDEFGVFVASLDRVADEPEEKRKRYNPRFDRGQVKKLRDRLDEIYDRSNDSGEDLTPEEEWEVDEIQESIDVYEERIKNRGAKKQAYQSGDPIRVGNKVKWLKSSEDHDHDFVVSDIKEQSDGKLLYEIDVSPEVMDRVGGYFSPTLVPEGEIVVTGVRKQAQGLQLSDTDIDTMFSDFEPEQVSKPKPKADPALAKRFEELQQKKRKGLLSSPEEDELNMLVQELTPMMPALAKKKIATTYVPFSVNVDMSECPDATKNPEGFIGDFTGTIGGDHGDLIEVTVSDMGDGTFDFDGSLRTSIPSSELADAFISGGTAQENAEELILRILSEAIDGVGYYAKNLATTNIGNIREASREKQAQSKAGEFWGRRALDSKLMKMDKAEAEEVTSRDAMEEPPEDWLLVWFVPYEYVKAGEAKFRIEKGWINPIWDWGKGLLPGGVAKQAQRIDEEKRQLEDTIRSRQEQIPGWKRLLERVRKAFDFSELRDVWDELKEIPAFASYGEVDLRGLYTSKKAQFKQAIKKRDPAKKAEEYKQSLFADEAFARRVASEVAEEAVRHASDVLTDVLEVKQITSHSVTDRTILEKEIYPRTEAYFLELAKKVAAGDYTSAGDFGDDHEYIREVLKPALVAAFKSGPGYQGFGPLSYINRLRKMEGVPWIRAMNKYYHEAHNKMIEDRGGKRKPSKLAKKVKHMKLDNPEINALGWIAVNINPAITSIADSVNSMGVVEIPVDQASTLKRAIKKAISQPRPRDAWGYFKKDMKSLLNKVERMSKEKERTYIASADTVQAHIAEGIFNLHMAETPEQKTAGLEPFDSLQDDEGMFFSFGEPQHVTFHMGKVKFPIDIIFLQEDDLMGLKVAKIIHNAQPKAPERWSCKKTVAVIELKGGAAKANKVKVGRICQLLDERFIK